MRQVTCKNNEEPTSRERERGEINDRTQVNTGHTVHRKLTKEGSQGKLNEVGQESDTVGVHRFVVFLSFAICPTAHFVLFITILNLLRQHFVYFIYICNSFQ